MPKISSSVGKGGKNGGHDVCAVQQLLNRFRYGKLLLKVDGRIGPMTLTAIADFQRHVVHLKNPDSLVLPESDTFRALCGGMLSCDRIAWGARVSADFKRKVITIAQELDAPVDFLMAAMAFESDETFSPDIENGAGSGAIGLIQFMPKTAEELGTTSEKLAEQTAEEQLDFVKKFFWPRRGLLKSLEDVYMAILYPAAIGKPIKTTLFIENSKAYNQNKGLDGNKDGKITINEAAMAVRKKYEKGIGPGYLG